MTMPPPWRFHAGRQSLIRCERREDVAEEHLLDQLERRVLERVHVPGADVAAVVDQHVDAAEARERRRRPRAASRRVRRGRASRPAPRAPSASDLARRLLEASGQRRRSTICFTVDECSSRSAPVTVRAVSTRSKPRRASSRAQPRPMPRLAPVTKRHLAVGHGRVLLVVAAPAGRRRRGARCASRPRRAPARRGSGHADHPCSRRSGTNGAAVQCGSLLCAVSPSTSAAWSRDR